jgi:hypothetical protein
MSREAVAPLTGRVAQYGPRVWDTLAANVPRVGSG